MLVTAGTVSRSSDGLYEAKGTQMSLQGSSPSAPAQLVTVTGVTLTQLLELRTPSTRARTQEHQHEMP